MCPSLIGSRDCVCRMSRMRIYALVRGGLATPDYKCAVVITARDTILVWLRPHGAAPWSLPDWVGCLVSYGIALQLCQHCRFPRIAARLSAHQAYRDGSKE